MLVLEVEPLDLGAEVKVVGLDLMDSESGEPARGAKAARVWGRVLPALAGQERWALDFFSHLDRLRAFCQQRRIPYREASARSIVVSEPTPEALESLLKRFETETFGARAGERLAGPDATLEEGLAQKGVDAYHPAFPSYLFCAACNFEDASLVLLTNRLWSSEVVRRLRPALADFELEVRQPV